MVGISLPLTGQFAADGLATLNGYKLWADDVNTNGGLLHRPVKLVIRNDNSNEKTVTSDYNVLIHQDHVDLTLAPFSTLLTSDAAGTHRESRVRAAGGSATGGLVFPKTYHNFFSVSLPVRLEMNSFAKWVTTLPASQRQTAAYPEVADPFADPPVDATEETLSQHGVKDGLLGTTVTPRPSRTSRSSRPRPRWRSTTRRSSSSARWTCPAC